MQYHPIIRRIEMMLMGKPVPGVGMNLDITTVKRSVENNQAVLKIGTRVYISHPQFKNIEFPTIYGG